MSKTRNKFAPEVRERAVRLRFGMGRNDLDRSEVRLHGGDAAPLVP